MSSAFGSSITREAVRVKVKKCECNQPAEWRKFSVDPQITSLEVLYSLLAKAFEIKTDFSIKYKAFDPAGNEIYLPVLSDWDLDAAFLRIHNLALQTSTEPCLLLQIDVKPFTEVKDWEANQDATTANTTTTSLSNGKLPTQLAASSSARDLMSPLQQSIGVSQKYVQTMQTRLPGLIMNQMEKTFSMVQKAFNLNEEAMAALPPRAPLCDNEFRLFLDALGQIQRGDELRKVIFFGGIDSSLRRVVWKHILNVYPRGMNGHQRMDYMRKKSEHYYKLRDIWKNAIKQGCVSAELAYVTSMVKKDVLRTDRLHPFYAGSDENQNIASLFNILSTYSLNHPSVSYCQGMSDIASPLLVTMNDEAQAYICFCAIMSRMRGNFMLDGIAMTQKFAHLTEALSFYDPEFWEYLKAQQADDLLFCYRWLLLELKREFPFEDSLRMLEVQWSSLKYERSADKELVLYEREFVPALDNQPTNTSSSGSSYYGASPISPSYLLCKQLESPYTKVCALRRQSSTASLNSLSTSYSMPMQQGTDASMHQRLNQSLDDNISRQAMRVQRRVYNKAHLSLDESKMLQLLEGIENEKSAGETVTAATAQEERLEDEVFANSMAPAETNHFNFHPTNPFIQDAELNNKTVLEAETNCHAKHAQIPKSISKLHNKNIISNYNAVSNIIAKQLATASQMGENVKSRSGGHFKDLKEKIAATSKKAAMSFDEATAGDGEKAPPKLVKNLNEFLNFATANKSRIADKFQNTSNAINANKSSSSPPNVAQTLQPLVKLTKSGFSRSLDDSDSSSVPENTYSDCTAATAIQQTQNLSSNSLQLELTPLVSVNHTPDPTPTTTDAAAATDITDEEQYYAISTAMTRELRLEAENLDRQLYGDVQTKNSKVCEIEYEKLGKDSLELMDELKENEIKKYPDASELLLRRRQRDAKTRSLLEPLQRLKASESDYAESGSEEQATPRSYASSSYSEDISSSRADDDDVLKLNPFVDDALLSDDLLPPLLSNSNSLPEVIVPLQSDVPANAPVEIAANAFDFATTTTTTVAATTIPSSTTTTTTLPPPNEFGGGNPFLMFLCLTLLLQHRNTIIRAGMDYNEIAMHFDKMVRKHDVTRVLNQARRMYIEYLKGYSEQRAATASTASTATTENWTMQQLQSSQSQNGAVLNS